ncbi:hypothetical protein HPB50_012120 [Hyalomma asiaticum]|uniref:Uncharacterized protein n=1 Tax=Hyalomma asiaticum TaxID=266040 RepID=A0ACB7S327_HYAAI|nr:hypothetical protein HPB50_012120 [Hyalomma asiaticum]
MQPLYLGIICTFKAYYRHHTMEHLLTAVDHTAASLPLRVSLHTAVVKAAWTEVMATCVQNCFRKASFVDVGPDAEPKASEEKHSNGNLWQHIVDSNMGGQDMCWDGFISHDDDVDSA